MSIVNLRYHYELAPSPNHGGPRPGTMGVVIHSTRGNTSSHYEEYAATLAWFSNPASQVSAHRVIGYDGGGAICVDDDLIAWHATDHNTRWLGVELTQPRITDPFSEAQYESLAALLKEWASAYGFPLDRAHLVAHSEINRQKSDPGPLFDWDKLMGLLEETMPDAQKAELNRIADIFAGWAKLRHGLSDYINASVGQYGVSDTLDEREGTELDGAVESLRKLAG